MDENPNNRVFVFNVISCKIIFRIFDINNLRSNKIQFIQMEKQQDPQLQKVIRTHANQASSVLWIILFLCLFFAMVIFFGSEPIASVKNTKLFPLFQSKKYHQLEKKIDSQSKVLLKGDEEEGLGIFIDQYINQRENIIKIKRRLYHFGKDLQFDTNNLFSKAYSFLKNAVSSLLKTEVSEHTLWVIQTDGALNLQDIETIHTFSNNHPNDKFLVTTQVAPAKASRFFKVIQYHELPKKMVSEYLFKNHKINKINSQNLMKSFGGNLQKINQIFQQQDVQAKFVESYNKQSQELNQLLAENTKEVKRFLDDLCKNGKVKTKGEVSFIPSKNNLVRYSNGTYHWKDIRSIFAFSDKFDVTCNSQIDIIYVAEEKENPYSWISEWFQPKINQQPSTPTPVQPPLKQQKIKKGKKVSKPKEVQKVEKQKKSQKDQKKNQKSKQTKKDGNKAISKKK